MLVQDSLTKITDKGISIIGFGPPRLGKAKHSVPPLPCNSVSLVLPINCQPWLDWKNIIPGN